MRSKKLITYSFFSKLYIIEAFEEFVSTGRLGHLWGSVLSLQNTGDDVTRQERVVTSHLVDKKFSPFFRQ